MGIVTSCCEVYVVNLDAPSCFRESWAGWYHLHTAIESGDGTQRLHVDVWAVHIGVEFGFTDGASVVIAGRGEEDAVGFWTVMRHDRIVA